MWPEAIKVKKWLGNFNDEGSHGNLVCTVEPQLSKLLWTRYLKIKHSNMLDNTTCASYTIDYKLIILFNASTVGYNTLQKWKKYLYPANPIFPTFYWSSKWYIYNFHFNGGTDILYHSWN